MHRLTCTDTDTRRAYAALLNAQIATQIAGQTKTMGKIAVALSNYRRTAAVLTGKLRQTRLSRTAHRPTAHATQF